MRMNNVCVGMCMYMCWCVCLFGYAYVGIYGRVSETRVDVALELLSGSISFSVVTSFPV